MFFGKFFSAVILITIAVLFTLIYYVILTFLGTPHLQTALVTILGFLLLSMAYISFGIFASSLTENQIIAGVITIAFFIVTWFMPQFSPALASFSLINMFSNFPSGQIALTEIITYVTFTLLFLCLTVIVMQRRKSVR